MKTNQQTNKEIEETVKAFREKWGRFYYSDTAGMDWEKPKKQNVTGGIPDGHDGYCIASGDIENDLRQALLSHTQAVEKKERAGFIADLYLCRSKMIRPLNKREQQNPQEILEYNWMNTIIAKLSDKYNVRYDDIKEALNKPNE